MVGALVVVDRVVVVLYYGGIVGVLLGYSIVVEMVVGVRVLVIQVMM